jgi:uncharacterized protein YbjT (DUF2867 family)
MSTVKMKFVIVGSTSDVGTLVAEELKSGGHQVTGIARSAGISLDDQHALNAAFKGADGAYLMVPFDMAAKDLHQREERLCKNLAEAVKLSGVKRVVVLSGANAYLKSGSSLGAAMLEEKINELGLPEVVHLRCGFFMENFIKGMAFSAQAKSGIYRTAFRGDIPTPMITTADIGKIAAGILQEGRFSQPRVRELLGPRDYTMSEATRILGAAIGCPDLVYEQSSYENAAEDMIAAGVSLSFAEAVMETARSFNSGRRWALEERSPANTTPTTLELFAKEAVRKGILY